MLSKTVAGSQEKKKLSAKNEVNPASRYKTAARNTPTRNVILYFKLENNMHVVELQTDQQNVAAYE